MKNNNTVVVVVGPTASGKTNLAVEFAKALDGEVVSADSMQIYKGMDIATAKPTKEEMCAIPHHLIDFADICETFSVAKYKELACKALDDIILRNKLPIIAGGTGLYVDAVINNTVFLDYEKSEIRTKLEEECEKNGIESLIEKLKEIDGKTAERLHINDKKRIIRALEVYYSTGKTISQQNEESHKKSAKYNFCIIGLNAHDRKFLYDRINKRVDVMLNQGLIEEAKQFFAVNVSNTAKQAIGYKELKPYFDGEMTLDEAVSNLKMETRRYAKRQLTWFRRNKDINWLYIDEGKDLVKESLEIINRFTVTENGQKKEN